jgi:hypothetical protein
MNILNRRGGIVSAAKECLKIFNYQIFRKGAKDGMNTEMNRITLYYLRKYLLFGDISEAVYQNLINWMIKYSEELLGENLKISYQLDHIRSDEAKKINEQKNNFPILNDKEKMEKAFKYMRAKILARTLPQRLNENWRIIANADKVVDTFHLPETEREIIRLIVVNDNITCLKDLTNLALQGGNIGKSHSFQPELHIRLGNYMGIPLIKIERALSREGDFFKIGFININDDGWINFTPCLQKLLQAAAGRVKELKTTLVKKITKVKLKRDDFDYMRADYNFLTRVIESAIRKRITGVNIILYGNPGTGKSEIVKTIADEIGASLYFLSEDENTGITDCRLSDAVAAKTLLYSETNAVLVLDDAEDIFNKNTNKKYSKLYLNRTLENNKTPVIWITNSLEYMDPAQLRRFTYALEMKVPPPEARARIWTKLLRKNRLIWAGRK